MERRPATNWESQTKSPEQLRKEVEKQIHKQRMQLRQKAWPKR